MKANAAMGGVTGAGKQFGGLSQGRETNAFEGTEYEGPKKQGAAELPRRLVSF
jgi:hypothetical protein